MYFLRLLGEDERDVQYHRNAFRHGGGAAKEHEQKHDDGRDPGKQQQQDFAVSGQEGAFAPGSAEDSHSRGKVTKWSWVGNRSPLMGDKEEAEWLLEKFFQRLEESLRGESMEKEEKVKGETAKNHPQEQRQQKKQEADGSIEDTVTKGRPEDVLDKQDEDGEAKRKR